MEPDAKGRAAKPLFISRAGADADFAAEIGSVLEAAGYAVTLQQWDFANRNFMERMHTALAEGARVIALLSPEYLRSEHCQAEWQNAIADDPLNTKSRLILLRVAECEPDGLLSGLAYWDLVPLGDDRALLEPAVLEAVREDRRDGTPSGPYWRAPRTIVDAEAIRSVPSFSGREDELAAIDAALCRDAAVAAVHGLGGVGKSSVAREYAWRNRDRYSVIWWLGAQTEDGIIESLLRLGALFVRGLDQLSDRRAAAQRVMGSMLSGFAKPVLLVFDNLEDERLVRTWLPRTGARALVTSRSGAWSADVTPISLQVWNVETAAAYLKREGARDDLTDAGAREIVETLGGLPLALSHAAASLRTMRMVTPQRYLERINDYLKSAPRAAEYPQSVFATFSTAIAQAEHEAAGAAALLSFAAFFAPDAIPDELFRQSDELYPLELRPTVSDELRLDEALGALDRLSLLSFAAASRTYAIHRLVRRAAQDAVAAGALAWAESAVAVADAAFPPTEFAAWPRCERLLPHVRAALDNLPRETASPSAGRLGYRCAVYLWQRGEFRAGELLHARALEIRERSLGPEHPEVGDSLNSLVAVLCALGRYEESVPLQIRSLAIREKVLGPQHVSVGMSCNNLGVVYDYLGRYDEAEALHTRGLAILEGALGRDHPEIASSLNNLAELYIRQGRLDQALPLHERALAIRERALAPDDPDLAYSLRNLAVLYGEEGRYDDAEALQSRSLAIWEKSQGTEHAGFAYALNDLARIYQRQQRFDLAESSFARALAIREKVLGPEHPDVATSLNDLGGLYVRQGRNGEAEPLLTRALEIRSRALGPDHPFTKSVREELVVLQSSNELHHTD